jgi:multimeric flavodoxin WrbA
MKKVTIISTSLRNGSNSHALAEQFAEGAKASFSAVVLAARKRLRAITSCKRLTN